MNSPHLYTSSGMSGSVNLGFPLSLVDQVGEAAALPLNP